MQSFEDVLCGFDEIKKVNITLFYGTHLPECIKFMKEQMRPTWDKFRNKMDIILVPNGRLSYEYVNGRWHFNCAYGPDELSSSRLHAVLADIFRINSKWRNRIMCIITDLMGHQDHRSELQNYMYKNESLFHIRISLNLNSISSAAKLAEYWDITNSFPRKITSFPSLIFNGVYNKQDELDSLKNFTQVVLKYIS